MKPIFFVALLQLLLWTVKAQNQIQQRFALVIGVNDYIYVQPLRNSLNDAQDISATLKTNGFKVIEVYNPKTKRELQDAIRTYFNLLNNQTDAAGLVFYSGHSMQVDGVNYLLPTTSNPQIKADLDDQAVKMDYMLGAIEQAGNPLNIFIMDACRNNPFRSFTRSVDPGLSQVNAPKGSYVLYATAPGSVASDGTGRNGLFTSKLLKYINTPNVAIEQVFKNVARDVQGESDGLQVPWMNISYFGDFYFSGIGSSAVPVYIPVTSNKEPTEKVNTIADLKGNAVHTMGERYGGGIVFYVYDGGHHGLIAATVDQSREVLWNVEYSVTNAINDSIRGGKYNTERIIFNQGPGNYAAQLCANYQGGNYNDWYLPSKYELNLLYPCGRFIALTRTPIVPSRKATNHSFL